MPLSFGLNTKKSTNSISKAAPARPSAFGADSDSESELSSKPQQNRTTSIAQELTTSDDNEPNTRSPPPPKPSRPTDRPKSPPKSKSRTNWETGRSADLLAQKQIERAEAEDASIFDYDAHFATSSSTAIAARRRAESQKEAAERKPKYMGGMQHAATQRKRDYLRAEDKKLQREREEDPNHETEAFVTEAYKARQAEVRRLEEEEREKETAEEEKRKNGMSGFWRGVWNEDEKRREDLATGEGIADVQEELDKEREIAEKAKRLNEQGANIQINEEGLVADKRQLLAAGLNVSSKGKGANSVPEKERAKSEKKDETQNEWDTKERRDARRAMGERHARLVEHQMEQAKKRQAEEEAAELQKREMSSKSKKTENDISSAKERYLQRKKEAEERKRLGIED